MRKSGELGRKLLKHETLIGRRFGKLVVIAELPERIRNGRVWQLLCDCGKTHKAPTKDLGKTRSCGCGRIPKPRLRPYEILYNILCYNREIRIDVNLSFEEFLEFTETTECHYCGSNVNWMKFLTKGEPRNTGYHLDRKDNTKGYSKDNCVVCCKPCNFSKSSRYTYGEWLAMTAALKQYRNSITEHFDVAAVWRDDTSLRCEIKYF